MKVYILMEHFPYEGDDIIAVYATKEDAERVLAELERDQTFGNFDVTEHEVKVTV